MFDKSVYVKRRQTLLERMKNSAAEGRRGIALFIGNTEAPAQYKDNCYKFRQDSTWLYFFGIDAPLYAAVIDLDNGEETIFADDVEIGDIIWMGPQPSVASIAAGVGIEKSAPYKALNAVVGKVVAEGRPVHFIKPSRYYNTMKIASLIGCGDGEVAGKFSLALTKAIISMRLVKEDCEIEVLDDAADLGYEMHSVARDSIRTGILEQEVVGKMEAVTLSKGWGVSFATILTQHGETLHNHLHDKIIEPGKLMVIAPVPRIICITLPISHVHIRQAASSPQSRGIFTRLCATATSWLSISPSLERHTGTCISRLWPSCLSVSAHSISSAVMSRAW